MEKISKRIGNLGIMKATYLCKQPSVVSWHIVKYYPNEHFGKEKNYVKLNHEFYCDPKNTGCRIHRSCFTSKEFNYAIASFDWNEEDECYNFGYVGDRPLDLNEEETKNFLELISYGFHQLNKSWYEVEDK